MGRPPARSGGDKHLHGAIFFERNRVGLGGGQVERSYILIVSPLELLVGDSNQKMRGAAFKRRGDR